MADDEHRVCLGVVISAHGIKGEVNVRSYSDAPEHMSDYGAFTDEKGNALEVSGVRIGPKGPVMRIAGVGDRNAAEALKGTKLYVDRDQLPDLDEDEFYHDDLVGLAVEVQGEIIGTVSAVHNFGAGDIIEIARTGQKSVMLPFTREIVPHVDIPGGVLGAEPPPGYFDEPKEEDETHQ
ncbi:MAG: ribosome maturation factor RimM [Alphaproteobacteria bacterium]|jgi:16S rRNA processing protein RimM|nr:ribosome maturation factor RimM [Alphaproteobacteria bacterium]MBT4711089.1 ribosome maturation factor RimM [Alphaproteobacteria bacterium]MBT5859959.1 ribosome maturation factor RimM [Alphaproteobacteria bacterium]